MTEREHCGCWWCWLLGNASHVQAAADRINTATWCTSEETWQLHWEVSVVLWSSICSEGGSMLIAVMHSLSDNWCSHLMRRLSAWDVDVLQLAYVAWYLTLWLCVHKHKVLSVRFCIFGVSTERACSQLTAAKEMVNLAEQGYFKH